DDRGDRGVGGSRRRRGRGGGLGLLVVAEQRQYPSHTVEQRRRYVAQIELSPGADAVAANGRRSRDFRIAHAVIVWRREGPLDQIGPPFLAEKRQYPTQAPCRIGNQVLVPHALRGPGGGRFKREKIIRPVTPAFDERGKNAVTIFVTVPLDLRPRVNIERDRRMNHVKAMAVQADV